MTKAEKQVYEETYKLFNGGIYGRKTYMGNVITLCKKHHDLVHTNKKLYMNKLIEIINRKMEE